MLASEIMTPDPITVAPGASLNSAMSLMDEHAIRHLPVVEGGRLAGIVSDRDLLEATGWLPVPPKGSPGMDDEPPTVGDLMHAAVKTAGPDDSVVTLALELQLRRIGCLPVTEAGRLLGIVTDFDLLRALAEAGMHGRIYGVEDPPVSEIMSAQPAHVAPDTPVPEAIEVCYRAGGRHLPVVENGVVVGIVSNRDFLRFVGRGQSESLPVREIMNDLPLTVQVDCEASLAADHLVNHKVSALPVLRGDEVVGILTASDLLEHCQNHLREAT